MRRLHTKAQLAVLAALTAAWFIIRGYAFGLNDHCIHLGFLLHELDGSLLAKDPLIASAPSHPSLFWTLQAPLLRWVPVEPTYLCVHVISVALMFAGTGALARALYPGRHADWVGVLAGVAVLVPHHLAGIAHMDPLVLNRTVSLGPLLFALALGAARRYRLAFLVTGAVFLIHPTTAIHAGILLTLAAALDRGRRKEAVLGPMVGALAASPLLFSMARHGSAAQVPFPPPDDWVLLTRIMVSSHHYPSQWPASEWLQLLGQAAVLTMSLRARRCRRAEIFALGIFVTCVAGAIGTEWLHFPAALHLHLQESLRFLTFLTAICGARWVLETWPAPGERRLPGLAAALAYFGFAVTLVSITLLGVVGSLVLRPPSRVRPHVPSLRGPLALAAVLVVVVPPVRARFTTTPAFFAPRVDMYEGARMMAWSRQHLPSDAVVVLPPFFGARDVAYRYGARRATFTTFKDGAEGSFSLAFMRDWRARMEALCACRPFERLAAREDRPWLDRVRELRETIRMGYREADAARLRGLAARYGATHAVIEAKAPPPLELPLVYSDDEFRIYRIDP